MATPSNFVDDLGGWAKVSYDFATDGGPIGDTTLDLVLPDNAIIYTGFVDVLTAPTSGGSATVALKIQGAGDLIAATAIASFTGQLNLVSDGAAANVVKLTAQRTATVTVAVAALTAGKFNLYLQYFQSE